MADDSARSPALSALEGRGQILTDNEYLVPYPFARVVVNIWDGDGYADVASWRPGHRYVNHWEGPEEIRADAIADGMGFQKLTVVSRHKPGRFPERVFYTRQWIDPDGKQFGAGGLKIVTAEKFRRISRGYAIEFRPYNPATDEAPPLPSQTEGGN